MKELSVLIVGVGGLGRCMVSEALERGFSVSIIARDMAKVKIEMGSETLERVSKIFVGDGSQAALLDEAIPGIDVVVSGRGADVHLAGELAAAVKRHDVKKLCWPAGSTNVMADDGITPNYQRLLHLGNWVEGAYRAHGACIDAIWQANINYVIFCPGGMASEGKRSKDVRASVRINRDGGDFVSYEDAAWVMLEAASTSTYDRELISAGTRHTMR